MRNDLRHAIAGQLPPPFFIIGCPRSGTTLVAQLLDSHSRIAVYLETQFYTLFRPFLHCYGDLRQPNNLRRFIVDVQEVIRWQAVMNRAMTDSPEVEEFLETIVAPSFEGVLTALLQLNALRQRKVRSADKTPDHYAYLPEILEKFPGSPIIFIMRDPRDTVFSMREAFGTTVETGVWRWNEALRSYQDASRPLHLVRYEELVKKPAEVVKAMCDYLGEPYEPAMLRFFERTALSPETAQHHRKLFGPVDSESVGRFRRLSSDEIQRIESACAAGMEAMGYPFTRRKPKTVIVKAPTKWQLLLTRLRYYGANWNRWRLGSVRWKIVLRVRARYLLTLRPWRISP
ncbi:MAG: sulfotransferase [Deltaproteobacteria bacterium]|nr:sulfotransferase [Deltaproteobacteria bacterium]